MQSGPFSNIRPSDRRGVADADADRTARAPFTFAGAATLFIAESLCVSSVNHFGVVRFLGRSKSHGGPISENQPKKGTYRQKLIKMSEKNHSFDGLRKVPPTS